MTSDAAQERRAQAVQHVDRELAGLVELMPATYAAADLTELFTDPQLRGRALGVVHRLDDIELIELILLAAYWYGERGE